MVLDDVKKIFDCYNHKLWLLKGFLDNEWMSFKIRFGRKPAMTDQRGNKILDGCHKNLFTGSINNTQVTYKLFCM